MNKPFRFKQFTVSQDRCAMKIGTDGVLLGAWTSLQHNPESILDIGAGTGVIALQMAQRSDAELIDALEIDHDAYEQCVENFENSPWGDRLFCYHASLQEFADEIEDKYDSIISNPPFFSEDYKTEDEARDKARFADALPFEHLVDGVSKLLSKKGLFSVILPKKEEVAFTKLGEAKGLFPSRICNVKGTASTVTKRVMLEFSFEKGEIEEETLIIEHSRHQYTDAYQALVKDFYLKM
ncbi:methyltransferase [Flavobacteriaceae bacterium TK19130]|nr:methyltransferase [Thermobacterium salinum]